MGQKIQTAILVAAITILVWLFAEGRQVREETKVATIQFVAPKGQDLAISPRTRQTITVKLKCTTAQIQEVNDVLARTILIEVQDGDRNMLLKEQLQSHKDLAGLAEIVDVQPAAISVRSEQLERVTAPIQPITGNVLFAQIDLDPREAIVLIPHSQLDKAKNLKLEARLGDLDFSSFEQNISYTVNVPIVPPAEMQDVELALQPDNTRATFVIRKQTDTLVLVTVPIRLNLPMEMSPQYIVDIREDQRVVRDLQISGPSDVIERIRSKQVRVWAELRLSAEDLDSGVTSRQLFINTPPGVTVDSPVPAVELRIAKRG